MQRLHEIMYPGAYTSVHTSEHWGWYASIALQISKRVSFCELRHLWAAPALPPAPPPLLLLLLLLLRPVVGGRGRRQGRLPRQGRYEQGLCVHGIGCVWAERWRLFVCLLASLSLSLGRSSVLKMIS